MVSKIRGGPARRVRWRIADALLPFAESPIAAIDRLEIALLGGLITSGAFSRECQQFCSGKRMRLLDWLTLTGLLEKYKVALSEAAH